MAAICHGPWVLCSTGTLKGRRVTGFFSIKDDLVNAGALFEDAEVVVDGNLVTSRKPEDLPAFCVACLEVLAKPRSRLRGHRDLGTRTPQELRRLRSGPRHRLRSRPAAKSSVLLGPNGAGKTTTIEILEGLRPRTAGDVSVLGLDPERNTRAVKQRIGAALQATNLQDKIKVREAMLLFANFYDRRTRRRRGAAAACSFGTSATPSTGSSRAARNSGWRSGWRWSTIPTCSSSTSPPPGSIRRFASRFTA